MRAGTATKSNIPADNAVRRAMTAFTVASAIGKKTEGVQKIRDAMREAAAGKPRTDEWGEYAATLQRALDTQKPDAPEVYRGVKLSPEELAQYKRGARMSMELSSFSGDRDMADEFTRHPAGRSAAATEPVLLTVLHGSRSFPINSLSKYDDEQEYLGAGQYEVVSSSRDKKTNVANVVLRQVSVDPAREIASENVEAKKAETETKSVATIATDAVESTTSNAPETKSADKSINNDNALDLSAPAKQKRWDAEKPDFSSKAYKPVQPIYGSGHKNFEYSSEIETVPGPHPVSASEDDEIRAKYADDTYSLPMNAGLRGTTSFLDGDRAHAELDKLDDGLQRLTNSRRLKQNVILYRGAGLTAAEIKRLVPGATFVDKGYGSTSPSKELAENYAEDRDYKASKKDTTPVVFTIRAPKGYPVSNIDDDSESGGDETLLQKNAAYRVLSVNEKMERFGYGLRSYVHVETELVPKDKQ